MSDGGNERDIRLVEDLATNYMSKADCIILLVISCESVYLKYCYSIGTCTNDAHLADFENQGAGRLVLKNQQLRDRTVGKSLS